MGRTRKEVRDRRIRQSFAEPSILSANLVDDPRFSAGTKWTFGTGWTNTTPTATSDGSAGLLTYDATGLVTAGKKYQLTINQAGTNLGLKAAFGGLTVLNISPIKDGASVALGVWEATDFNLIISVQILNDFVGTVTNVILQEVL